MLSARNIEWGRIEFSEYREISDNAFERERARTDVRAGDVLLTIVGTIGRAAVVTESMPEFTLQRSVALLRLRGIDPKFCMYQLLSESTQDWLRKSARGSAQQGVYLKTLRELPIVVPPLDQQGEIVAEIEKQFTRLGAGVAGLRRVEANLKRYRAAVLKAACEGSLFCGTVREVSGATETTYGPLADLPNTWRWTTPKEVCDKVIDCHNKTAPYSASGIPLIRTTNIRGGKVDLTGTRFVDLPTYEYWSRRCYPQPGDVLFTREAPMGEVGIIPHGAKVCMGQRIMLMRTSKHIANSYLLIALQAPQLKTYIDRTAVGSGVKHLRVKDVEDLPLPLPPLAEQQRILAEVERRLSVVDELETAIEANLRRAYRLRQAILQRVFERNY